MPAGVDILPPPMHEVPPHVGDAQPLGTGELETSHSAWYPAEPVSLALLARREQKLHAKADTEGRNLPRMSAIQGPPQPELVQASRCDIPVTNARNDEFGRALNLLPRRGHFGS